jgi:hypothetical protein
MLKKTVWLWVALFLVIGSFLVNSRTVFKAQAAPLPIECPKKSIGDANCDKFVDSADYTVWRCELLGNGNCANPATQFSADFNADTKVNINDFEIWRQGTNIVVTGTVDLMVKSINRTGGSYGVEYCNIGTETSKGTNMKVTGTLAGPPVTTKSAIFPVDYWRPQLSGYPDYRFGGGRLCQQYYRN